MNFFKKYGLKEDEDQYKVKEILLDSNTNVKSMLKNIIKFEKKLTKKKYSNKWSQRNRKRRTNKIIKNPDIYLDDNEESEFRVILVKRENGTGKTTLINDLMNYLIDINFVVDIYFNKRKVVLNSKSSTDRIIIYHIKFKKGFHKVIDTQGYGDTRGRKKYIEITSKI